MRYSSLFVNRSFSLTYNLRLSTPVASITLSAFATELDLYLLLVSPFLLLVYTGSPSSLNVPDFL